MHYFSNPKNLYDEIKRFEEWLITKRKLLFIIFGGITILFLIIIFTCYPEPPLITIALSRIALSQARKVDAEIYVPQLFNKAESSWYKTIEIWHRENQKLFFRRDFTKVHDLALKTNDLAKQAQTTAIHVRDSLRNIAHVEIVLLQAKINEFKDMFRQVPIHNSSRDQYTRGELFILEAQEALKRQDYKQCLIKLKRAEFLIGQAGSDVNNMLNTYLKNIPKWKQWAQETIDSSQHHKDVAIIIDKIDHSCMIYDQGQLSKKYPVEFGVNWIGHKRQKGDNATPEGKYFIRKKVPSGQSKYYKALVIDYPNKEDEENFIAAKQRGELPPTAQIGGSIEIHGDGGKGINWTQGCIALKNEDLDHIFNIVKIGTPVTIVGSINGPNNNNHYPKKSTIIKNIAPQTN